MKVPKTILLIVLIWGWVTVPVFAQEDALRLSLSRDFGSGFGTNIQGRFSMRVEGPDNLVRVVFMIDGEAVAEQTTAPFRYQFNTDTYPSGQHVLSATGYTTDNQELQSNQLTRNFLTGGESTYRTLFIIVPILILLIGGRFLSTWITKRGSKATGHPAIDGPYGGTICPRCEKPFARHIWAPNLVTVKLDRCPHCGKWSFARRLPPDVLQAAADKMAAETTASKPPDTPASDDFQTRLDDSRFDQ
jgi:hypothetical protein